MRSALNLNVSGPLMALAFLLCTFPGCKPRHKEVQSQVLSDDGREQGFFADFLESFEFIGFYDMAVAMSVGNPTPWTRYDNDTNYKVPLLKRWRDCKKILSNATLVNEDILIGVYRILVESPQGTYRTKPVVAGGDYELPEYKGQQNFFAASPSQVAALQKNPYLVTTVAKTSIAGPSGTVFARYEYPSASTWKRFESLLSPALVKQLGAAEKDEALLTQKIVRELVTGLLSKAISISPVVLYQSLISIHPFSDANGRATRLMYYMANHRRPLFLRSFNEDTFSTPQELEALVKVGDRSWDAMLASFGNELKAAKSSSRTPNYYPLAAQWCIAVNRIDMINAPHDCQAKEKLANDARSYFNLVPIKKKIDRKEYVIIDNEMAQQFGIKQYHCP